MRTFYLGYEAARQKGSGVMRADQYVLEARLAENGWWWVARRNIISKIMDRYLNNDRRYRLLEVGCGTGSNLRMLSQYGDVQGIEMSPAAVDFCRQRYPEFESLRA